MELEPSAEQKLLAETVDDLLGKRYDAQARLSILQSEAGWSAELWQQYAQLGLLGLLVDEEHGGAGMGIDELAAVMQSFGRALILEPFLATVVLGAGLVDALGSEEQRRGLLSAVAAGELLLAFALTEPGSRWSIEDLTTEARPAGDGWTVTGEKIAVLGGDLAHTLVVAARTPDAPVGLFLVDAADPGVRRAGYAFQDGQRGADIVLHSAAATPLGSPEGATAAIDSVIDTATAALCAEAVGAMERMLTLTVDYLKTRVQFGRPIASFQSLQYRAADMYVSLEQARSMAVVARLAAGGATDAADRAQRRTMIRAAKLQIDRAARHVGQEAVQLHGGIGMTMEYPVGHYLKRVTVLAKTFADDDRLVTLIGAAGGLIDAG